MKRIGSINEQASVAEKLDVMRLTYMVGMNPNYPLCDQKKARSVKPGYKSRDEGPGDETFA